MKITVAVIVLAFATLTHSYHFLVGNYANRVTLINHTTVQYNGIPFMKRVKQYFYATPENRIIAGIQALDMLNSKAVTNITAGGIGFPFVNMRMKSERGLGLHYDIGIYVQNKYI